MSHNIRWSYDQGEIIGWAEDEVYHASGITYAYADRFAYPEVVKNNKEIVKATSRSVQVIQNISGPFILTRSNLPPMKEGILQLAITTPNDLAPDERVPVMAFIHGGAYLVGTSDILGYRPNRLMMENRVIVVRFNYRMGILGYSRDKEGQQANLGLLDQIAALTWIQRHIENFGGDKNDVTLFGQSAGADSVISLLLSLGTENLFHKAIIQSAPFGMRNQAQQKMEKIVYDMSQEITDEMTIEEILDFQAETMKRVKHTHPISSMMPFMPRLGVHPLPDEDEVKTVLRERTSSIPILIGHTTQEVNFFIRKKPLSTLRRLPGIGFLMQKLLNHISEKVFIDGEETFAHSYEKCDGQVIRYIIDYGKESNIYRSAHAIELPLLFHAEGFKDFYLLEGSSHEEIVEDGEKLRYIWATFAKEGTLNEGEIEGLIEIK